MTDGRSRVLSESEWQACRDLRLEALREAPDSFVASYDEELQYDEELWRERMRQERWLIAERDGKTVGVVGLGAMTRTPKTVRFSDCGSLLRRGGAASGGI